MQRLLHLASECSSFLLSFLSMLFAMMACLANKHAASDHIVPIVANRTKYPRLIQRRETSDGLDIEQESASINELDCLKERCSSIFVIATGHPEPQKCVRVVMKGEKEPENVCQKLQLIHPRSHTHDVHFNSSSFVEMSRFV
jgi:hypothetical protein